jgi:hypothetical protein
MISRKRRREMWEDAKRFHEAWVTAKAFRKAGASPETARAIIESIKMSKGSPDEQPELLRMAKKRLDQLIIEGNERRMQGLPPLEDKGPTFH